MASLADRYYWMTIPEYDALPPQRITIPGTLTVDWRRRDRARREIERRCAGQRRRQGRKGR